MTGARLRAGAVLLFVFAAGLLIGVGYERHHIRRIPATMSLTDDRVAALAELQDFLELDDEQVRQLHTILAARQETVEKMWEQFRPEVQAAMREVHEEVAALLRPDQVERFHAWLGRHMPASGMPH
jgi:hypothetical protein